MLGLVIGIIAGGFQFWLLSKFTKRVTGGSLTASAVLVGLAQFLLPFAVLIGMAFLRRQDLIWAAVGVTGALIGGVLIKFIMTRYHKRERGNEK
jgi:hypothetical protein